jgi:hypothetical protein
MANESGSFGAGPNVETVFLFGAFFVCARKCRKWRKYCRSVERARGGNLKFQISNFKSKSRKTEFKTAKL